MTVIAPPVPVVISKPEEREAFDPDRVCHLWNDEAPGGTLCGRGHSHMSQSPREVHRDKNGRCADCGQPRCPACMEFIA